MARRPSASDPSPDSARDEEEAPGLGEQLGRTRRAFTGLVSSHFRLLSAELSEIMDEIKRALALIAAAVALIVLAGLMLGLGTVLWLDEWAFGSIGWGVVHGAGFFVATAVVAVLLILPNSGVRLGTAFGVSLLVAVITGIVFGLRLTSRAWGWVGDTFFGGLAWPDGSVISTADRPVVVAVLALAVIFGALGALIGFALGEGPADRFGNALGGTLVGALVGALLGGLLGVPMSWGCAVATALAVFLILLPILALSPRPAGGRLGRTEEAPDTEPDHRNHQGDDRVGARTDAARAEVVASRQLLLDEVVRLQATGRATFDIPGRLRRQPARVGAAAAGVAFLALKGPQRLYRGARRVVLGPRANLPKSMLPKEIDKAVRSLGDDGERVRGVLEREFAAYLERGQAAARGS